MPNAAGVIFFAVVIPGVQVLVSLPRSLITYVLVPAPARGVMVLDVQCFVVVVSALATEEVAVELVYLLAAPRRHDETKSWQ